MMDWENLEKTCRACTRCGLCETRTNVVFGVGKRNADVMLNFWSSSRRRFLFR